MKVVSLQLLLSNVAQFSDAAGSSRSTIDELRRAAECLDPFKECSLVEFSEFLRNAAECVRSGTWPAPGKKSTSRARGGSKMSVSEAAQRFQALRERVTDANLTTQMIDAEIEALGSLKVDELKEVAAQVGRTIPSKVRAKAPILEELKNAIKGLKESNTFNQYRPASTPA